MYGVLTDADIQQLNNIQERDVKIIFITGILGSGKTTLLINLLRWLQAQGQTLPPVIVNDRGNTANLDYGRVTAEVDGVAASDLLGQCIGCGGKGEFLTLVRQMQDDGLSMLIVEPTGLFTLAELNKIGEELQGCSTRSVHLVPAGEVQVAAAVGIHNLRHCRLIALTHARQDETARAHLLSEAVGKRVVIVQEDVGEDQLADIWAGLMAEESQGHVRASGGSCSDPGCSRPHCGADHHHHHGGRTHPMTFSTEGWTLAELIGYLLSIDSLIRFKGVVEDGGDRIQVEWAHGSWGQRQVPDAAPLKADLFTRERIEKPSRVALTDHMIGSLAGSIPPVWVESPSGGYGKLDANSTTAWTLLYKQSQRASDEVRLACGRQLIDRSREAATFLIEGDLSLLDPRTLDYARLQTAMVWLWWNQEFGFELDEEDRRHICDLLAQLDPERVDEAALRPWMGETYAYLPRLKEQFPSSAAKIVRVQERMEA